MRDWFDISYLCKGTPRQRVAWETLTELGVFRHLAPFTPVLTGTIPIGLDLPGSDLDIVCRAEDLALFEEAVAGLYAHRLGFESKRRVWQGRASVVVNFDAGTFPVELFAQDRPVTEQNAYRHMRIDERLLRLGGDAARTAIMALRQSGMKTEPAFAAYFNLVGDPYDELLHLSWLDDATLSGALSLPFYA